MAPFRRALEVHDNPARLGVGFLEGGLVARSRELAHIDQVLWQARRGRSGAIGLRGESGVGKSSLVEAAVARATEFRTVQLRGWALEPERTSALPEWPEPLVELASTAWNGSRAAAPLARFASLGDRGQAAVPTPTMVEAAANALRRLVAHSDRSLLLAIDDCHVLPKVLVTAIAAAVITELRDEPISVVLAWRDTPLLEPFEIDCAGVPVHRLGGLTSAQARELLALHFDQLPDGEVLVELVGRSGGNPMALVDVCGRLTPAQLSGWHPLPDPLPIGESLVEAFDVVRHLPAPTRRALALTAAGGVSRDVMSAALARIGSEMDDLAPAVAAGVIEERGPRIDFRHPLVRSAAFYREPREVRVAVRRAVSEVLDERDAIEASAHQAALDADKSDETASRRLIEAARLALDRGDPAVAARDEELAAMCASSADAVGQHLADACGHWMAAGKIARARECVEPVSIAGMSEPVVAELAYQRARLVSGPGERGAADRMVAAAESCVAERPHRALAMLVDAAAWRLLANQPGGTEQVAARAVALARGVSSHSEVLAHAVRTAAVLACGIVDEVALPSDVALLIGQTERFPSSPEVALVIGQSLETQGMRHQASRWAQWIARCAERSGDVGLDAVSALLAGSLLLTEGKVTQAMETLFNAALMAREGASAPVAAWASHLVVHAHSITGAYQQGFSEAAALFARTEHGGLARLRLLPALSLLELQRGRTHAAVAWIRILEQDLGIFDPTREAGALEPELFAWPASLLLVARARGELEQWAAAGAQRVRVPAAGPAGKEWLQGLFEPDPAQGCLLLESAAAASQALPLQQALIDVCRAVRLGDCGRTAEAASVLEAVEERARYSGAAGLALLAAHERSAIPEGAADRARVSAPPGTRPDARVVVPGPAPDWELALLGGFSIRHLGAPVALPASLATQAVKIVALWPRITVDELIEHLWEEAEPGVGARRLRNVLWRIRSACGDLLLREGEFLRLAPKAVTDVARFRELAEQALLGGSTEQAVDTARVALALYRGELLPGDRYADWSTAARESLARTHLRLLDLLVDAAVAAGRHAEAIVLLDRLVEVDPFDERHHLRTAEIHLHAGNRHRAFEALERAERMLAGLSLPPSPAVRRLRELVDRS
jgi:DNA-binding SARP family transcriptional activator